MQKIIDGLLFDTEKADLICSFGNGSCRFSDEEFNIFKKLKMIHEYEPDYLDLCFIFQTNKDRFFAIGVVDKIYEEESVEYIKNLDVNIHIALETFVGNLLERFPHLEISWRQLTEPQARKLCEGHLSVSEYMKHFSTEEA